MELIDTAFAFLAWLWFWFWRIALVIVLLFIVSSGTLSFFRKKRIRRYVSHPIDWLTVMSTERWNTRGELAELMNARCKTQLFSIFSSKETFWKFLVYKHLFGFDLMMIIDDLSDLEESGLIENRVVYYDLAGNVFPGDVDFSTRDSSLGVLGMEREFSKNYLKRDEYRKTGRGGGVTRKTSQQSSDGILPDEGLVVQS